MNSIQKGTRYILTGFLFCNINVFCHGPLHNSRKGLHKGTSEAPVLSESEREHRSKVFLWGEGKRKRFPLQLLWG